MLEKDYNIYVVDDVFDDNFACDFRAQSLEEKYEDSDVDIAHIKWIVFADFSGDGTPKKIRTKNLFFDKDSRINVADYALRAIISQYDPPSITEEEYYKELEVGCEVGYDEESIYHDRDIDYDYDYEYDCEYDSDEEIYGSYDNDDYDEY